MTIPKRKQVEHGKSENKATEHGKSEKEQSVKIYFWYKNKLK